MGIVQKDALRTMILSFIGILLGYVNKGFLFLIILTTDEIGLLNLVLSLGLLFAQFSGLGNSFTIWKFLPFFRNEKNKHNGFLPFVLIIAFVGIAFFSGLYIAFSDVIKSYYVNKSEIFNEYYYWVLPIGIGYVLFQTLETYLMGFYRNVISVFAYDIVLRLSLTVCLVLYGLHFISFDLLVILHSIIYLVPVVVLILYLKKIKQLNLDFSSINISKRFRKILIQFSSYNYINTLGAILVNSLDVIMIAAMVGLEATGVYTTIVFFIGALQVPYRSVLRISGPLVADHWKNKDMDKMQELYTKVSSTGLLIGIVSFIYLWLNIDLAFSFLRPEFQPGIWVFFFIMLGRLLDMFFGINGAIFSMSKKYKYDIIFTIFLIGVVYAFNLYLIPIYGMVGAAISTGVAFVVYNIGRVIFVWKIFKIHPFTKNQFVIIILAIITLFFGYWISFTFPNLWIRLGVNTALFIITFIFPIYYFNLEPDTKNFIQNGTRFIRKKLGLNKDN